MHFSRRRIWHSISIDLPNRLRQEMNKVSIDVPAISDKDIRKICDHFRISDSLDLGTAKCCHCGTDVNWENLVALVVREHTLLPICSRCEGVESGGAAEP